MRLAGCATDTRVESGRDIASFWREQASASDQSSSGVMYRSMGAAENTDEVAAWD
jgi:hypothetical protein